MIRHNAATIQRWQLLMKNVRDNVLVDCHDCGSRARFEERKKRKCDEMAWISQIIITIPFDAFSRSKKENNFICTIQRQIEFHLIRVIFLLLHHIILGTGPSALCEYIKCHHAHYVELENVGLRMPALYSYVVYWLRSVFFCLNVCVSSSW